MERVRVVNMTTFFNRELLMYSLGDIKFKKPIALKKVAYMTIFLIVWAIPWILILGLPTSPFVGIWELVIPVVAGHFAAKPIFGGKGLMDYVKTLIGKMGEPKGWTDFKSNNVLESEVLFVDNEVWISRRREMELLASDDIDSVVVDG